MSDHVDEIVDMNVSDSWIRFNEICIYFFFCNKKIKKILTL